MTKRQDKKGVVLPVQSKEKSFLCSCFGPIHLYGKHKKCVGQKPCGDEAIVIGE